MTFLKFFKKKKTEDSLVLDFGRSSVKGIVFQARRKKIIIKDFQIEDIDIYGVFDGKDFEVDVVKKATDKVIENLRIKEKFSEIKKIIGFSPDVVKAKVFDISFKREKSKERIDEKEKEEIYTFVFKKSEKELFEEESADIQILKRKILEEKISGYQVPSISGFKGKDLSFRILVIFSSKIQFDFINSLKKKLSLEKAEIFHNAENLIDFLGRENKTPRIFLDIGARSTSIYFFQETLESVGQIPVGGYDFTKRISENLGLREDDAEELKKDFSKKKLSPKIEKRVEEIILPVLNFWQKKLEEKIKDRIRLFGFSGEIYLFGGGSLLPLIEKAIKEKFRIDKVKLFSPDNLPLENKTKFSFSSRETSSLLLTLSRNVVKR